MFMITKLFDIISNLRYEYLFRAWVPLKDCFLYSKIPPQPAKIKKSNHLESGIQVLSFANRSVLSQIFRNFLIFPITLECRNWRNTLANLEINSAFLRIRQRVLHTNLPSNWIKSDLCCLM